MPGGGCTTSIFFQQPRPCPLLAQPVARVPQRAVAAGQTAAADTTVQFIAQRNQRMNTSVQLFTPLGGELFPLFRAQRVALRQHPTRLTYRRQGNTDSLRNFDNRHVTENVTGIAALVSAVTDAFN